MDEAFAAGQNGRGVLLSLHDLSSFLRGPLNPPADNLAYLVIREGAKWTDVFRLIPGRTITIGRSSTNQIVVKDERASRNHAEIFLTRGRWTLRDLDSRNGTEIAGEQVQGDYPLSPGEVVRIAHFQMAFVNDISQAFRDGAYEAAVEPDETVQQTAVLDVAPSSIEPTMITHRRDRTRYLEAANEPEEPETRTPAARQLCRLAFELAKQADVVSAAQLALEGLTTSVRAEGGAVLLPKESDADLTRPDQLEIVASFAGNQQRYYRVSSFLAQAVIREGEAVLARNVADDSMLAGRDSKGVIHANSVICAPIRHDGRVLGVLHLYTTAAERHLEADDLEFALAVADNMALALNNLRQRQELTENLSESRREIRHLRRRLGAESQLVGRSEAMERVRQQIAMAAPSRSTILIRGESGVGKELVARAVHFSSPRKKGPFICLNCAALSETLLESELFGHERGAFTGATERKIGKFEAADQGTLMLDEIGEMSQAIQAKFLRVLEGHPFERVGGNKSITCDVRVIAATNRDLEQAVLDKSFRRDLYFRLRVIEILAPPLRTRDEDVVELAAFFLGRFNAETGRRIRGFTKPAISHLRDYHWPGNVRELKNVIERAVVMCRQDVIHPEDLLLSPLETSLATPPSDAAAAPSSADAGLSLAEVEQRHIQATLEHTGWNKSKAAAILGIERSTLDRKLRRYKVAKPN